MNFGPCRFGHFARDFVHDRLRRRRLCHQSVPGYGLVAGIAEFGDGRHVGQLRHADFARHRESPDGGRLCTCGIASDRLENIVGRWPAMMSVSAGALPR